VFWAWISISAHPWRKTGICRRIKTNLTNCRSVLGFNAHPWRKTGICHKITTNLTNLHSVPGCNHYKKLFNLWRILRDVFKKHHECALQLRTLWWFLKFVVILWRILVFRHGCALKPKTLRWFVKFVVILRRIPVFCHGCALMDIQAQNTATYSYFSSRMCSDGYSSPEHCDVFLFFVTDVDWLIFKSKTLQRFFKFVEIQPTTLRRFSRFVTINK
jgi:hypothetical protein